MPDSFTTQLAKIYPCWIESWKFSYSESCLNKKHLAPLNWESCKTCRPIHCHVTHVLAIYIVQKIDHPGYFCCHRHITHVAHQLVVSSSWSLVMDDSLQNGHFPITSSYPLQKSEERAFSFKQIPTFNSHQLFCSTHLWLQECFTASPLYFFYLPQKTTRNCIISVLSILWTIPPQSPPTSQGTKIPSASTSAKKKTPRAVWFVAFSGRRLKMEVCYHGILRQQPKKRRFLPTFASKISILLTEIKRLDVIPKQKLAIFLKMETRTF